MSINDQGSRTNRARRSRGAAVIGVGVSAAVLLGACGSSKAPTRAAFNQQASAICSSVTKKVNADGDAAAKASTGQQAAPAFQRALDDTNAGIKQLKALKEPKGDNSQFEAALGYLDQGATQIQKIVTAAKNNDKAAASSASDSLDSIGSKTDKAFTAAGLPACASDGDSSSSGG